MNPKKIGLFGTCGSTLTWRKPFIQTYTALGYSFFNPQILDREWHPADGNTEQVHLDNDEIVLFPVTGETYGTASLAEIGIAAVKVILSAKPRHLIVLVTPVVDSELEKENPVAAKESKRARTLVLKHLKTLVHSRIHLVNTFDEMLKLSLELYKSL